MHALTFALWNIATPHENHLYIQYLCGTRLYITTVRSYTGKYHKFVAFCIVTSVHSCDLIAVKNTGFYKLHAAAKLPH